MGGCAANLAKNDCKGNEACVWKTGYPPLEFASDSDYILVSNESLFADTTIVQIVNDMDYRMMIGFVCLFAAVIVFAFRQYSIKKEKIVTAEETTKLLA